MATVNRIVEFKTLGDIARETGAHFNSARRIALGMGAIAGQLGRFDLVRSEDYPAVVAEVRRRIRRTRPAA